MQYICIVYDILAAGDGVPSLSATSNFVAKIMISAELLLGDGRLQINNYQWTLTAMYRIQRCIIRLQKPIIPSRMDGMIARIVNNTRSIPKLKRICLALVPTCPGSTKTKYPTNISASTTSISPRITFPNSPNSATNILNITSKNHKIPNNTLTGNINKLRTEFIFFTVNNILYDNSTLS